MTLLEGEFGWCPFWKALPQATGLLNWFRAEARNLADIDTSAISLPSIL
jgi:hypothetical protein